MTDLELSRPLVVTELTGRGQQVMEIGATEAECSALARRFGFEAIDALNATLRLSRAGGSGLLTVKGHMAARVTQICVVRLEPFQSVLEVDIERLFREDEPESGAVDEVEIDPEGEDPPDPIVDGVIDLGEVLAEELGLAQDPYPHSPGARFETLDVGAADEEGAGKQSGTESPFAALAALRKRMDDK